ncbi:hypothetical protein E8L99_20880 [Phreatobacter aquaticus]|uniref:Uncharacterized protein n=1 Tax=Phreatobacter aquaticus TaxID=2570229 RepID=A0A4D7QPY2_9HYPH|nr:hypothetical protein [Phreatobacter aquaticus]QCK88033.1 hypothetical protein E8L99_20880 [Phreatobacter aquaticus]
MKGELAEFADQDLEEIGDPEQEFRDDDDWIWRVTRRIDRSARVIPLLAAQLSVAVPANVHQVITESSPGEVMFLQAFGIVLAAAHAAGFIRTQSFECLLASAFRAKSIKVHDFLLFS